MKMTAGAAVGLMASLFVAGCAGIQSALDPSGPEAARVTTLSAVLFTGGALILVLVMALTALALFGGERSRGLLQSRAAIIGGGVIFPAVTLGALLVYGFMVLRAGGSSPDAPPALRIAVIGHQWWWRVIYTLPDGRTFESANELRIPVGGVVELTLSSNDVIHSFWVPHLAGKLDMIPGRTTRLHVQADAPRTSRGQCTEYCGGAHALMSFFLVAEPPDAHAAWVAHEAGDARAPVTAEEREGQAGFVAAGCGGCHAIRGTEAMGRIAPDLTHVGGRLTLAAGVLPNDAVQMARWIRHHPEIKPDTYMPRYDLLSERDVAVIATYLSSLK